MYALLPSRVNAVPCGPEPRKNDWVIVRVITSTTWSLSLSRYTTRPSGEAAAVVGLLDVTMVLGTMVCVVVSITTAVVGPAQFGTNAYDTTCAHAAPGQARHVRHIRISELVRIIAREDERYDPNARVTKAFPGCCPPAWMQ
jgi:hypothetical protein